MLDLPLPALVATFGVSSAIVIVAGIVLARSGDQLAQRTGLGGLLVGTILLAGATSLPELATDVSAALVGAPDLALGAVFGSSMANMAILATIDLLHRGRVWPSVGLGQARVATVAIALTAIAVLGLVAPTGFAIGWLGVESVVIVGGYVAAALWIRRSPTTAHRRAERTGEVIAPTGWGAQLTHPRSIRAEAGRFIAASAAVLGAAPVLTLSADGIAIETGIGESFIGTLLLAATTSLPELVASVAAVRLGAYDLAVGNLFGSNALNLTTLLAADAAFVEGPILAAGSAAQAVAGVGAILMMALALAAVVHGEQTRVSRLEPDALLVLVIWVVLLGAVWSAST